MSPVEKDLVARLLNRDPDDVTFSEQNGFTHKNHTWWHQAPLPRRWHQCQPWSSGPVRGMVVQRCACGAIRDGDSGVWVERNSRRKENK
jgi:hypothetical protein